MECPLGGSSAGLLSGSYGRETAVTGRVRNDRFGVNNGDKPTFVHGDCRR